MILETIIAQKLVKNWTKEWDDGYNKAQEMFDNGILDMEEYIKEDVQKHLVHKSKQFFVKNNMISPKRMIRKLEEFMEEIDDVEKYEISEKRNVIAKGYCGVFHDEGGGFHRDYYEIVDPLISKKRMDNHITYKFRDVLYKLGYFKGGRYRAPTIEELNNLLYEEIDFEGFIELLKIK